MIRNIAFVILCLCLWPSQSWAQSVSVRTGDHDGYSRIVFALDSGASYSSALTAANNLRITIQSSGDINSAGLSGRNIGSVAQVSENPITVDLEIIPAARTRVFNIGSRVIADIYDVEGQSFDKQQNTPDANDTQDSDAATDSAAQSQSEQSPSEQLPTPPPQEALTNEQAAQEPATEEAGAELSIAELPVSDASQQNGDQQSSDQSNAEQDQITNALERISEQTGADIVIDGGLSANQNIAEMMATRSSAAELSEDQMQQEIEDFSDQNLSDSSDNLADVIQENIAPEQEEEAAKPVGIADLVKPENLASSNLISISSTESFGMALYEESGRIWAIIDKTDLLYDPKVSGADADYFLPIERQNIRGGVLYTTRAMDGAYLKGQGGGVLWQIISSPSQYESAHIEPFRYFEKNDIKRGKLIFPFKQASAVMDMKDVLTGADLKVVTVASSEEYGGPPRNFVEFEILRSPIGLVIRPRVDNLNVKITDMGVEISRPEGLSLMPEKNLLASRSNYLKQAQRREAEKMGKPELADQQNRIFRFELWEMGGAKRLNQNKNIILSTFKELTSAGQVEDLINLGKMHLANGRAAEALGFLRFAHQELPALETNPEFRALKGAAYAYDEKYESAYHHLIIDQLDQYPEVQLWRAYVFAGLGDWDQAYSLLSDDLLALYNYPLEVRNRLGILLAEIALRGGDTDLADKIFTILEVDIKSFSIRDRAALAYLRGEYSRQKGDLETTKTLWDRLSRGRDELYSVKAGLALARLLRQEEDISYADAIDRLERLRFSWRGDELEAQVNYWLGQYYFENGQYIKGLKIMRESIGFAQGTLLAPRIASQMTRAFTELYTSEELAKVNPLDAVALYDQFSELTPPGSRGDDVLTRLAEHLVQSDLLDRATTLFNYQLTHRLSGMKAVEVATRLAAIHLIADKPDAAVLALNKSEELLAQIPESQQTQDKRTENQLLRARALSMRGNPQQALDLLERMSQTEDVNRLRATIAWDANYWDDAAIALRDVIFDQNISLTRPLIEDHATLLLNRAVSLNLAGDRIGLANMRERYMDAMSQTKRARMFEVVTRARQNAALADRETLLSITSEVDLFGEFLDSYRQSTLAEN